MRGSFHAAAASRYEVAEPFGRGVIGRSLHADAALRAALLVDLRLCDRVTASPGRGELLGGSAVPDRAPTGTPPCKPVFRSGIRCKPQSRNCVANRTHRNGQASGFGAQLSVGQIASEIRLGRPRRIGIFSRVPLEVFSTNHFRPAVRILHIRHGCCPRRREDIFILDSELELQVFT
jgi:hypothetical protein